MFFGFFPFIKGERVPIFGWIDLLIHEFGHFATALLPEPVTLAMGSGMQILLPLGIGLYFLLARKSIAEGAVCLAWAGSSAQDASVYIADAKDQVLPLIGGEHDWGTLLGPEHLNVIEQAHTIAAVVYGFGLALFLTSIALCLAGPWIDERRARRDAGSESQPPDGGYAIGPEMGFVPEPGEEAGPPAGPRG